MTEPLADAQLEAIARQAVNMVRADMDRKRVVNALLGLVNGGTLLRMRTLERAIAADAGPRWASDPDRKAAVWKFLRNATASFPAELGPPEAFVIAGACLAGEGEGPGQKSLYATVQTDTRTCLRIESLQRGGAGRTEFYDAGEVTGEMVILGGGGE